MSVSFANLKNCIDFVLKSRYPVLLRSAHGQGKSSWVYQVAESIKLPVVERRASQMTEGDLLGLPAIDNGRTSWLPPDWFATACEMPVVLFIDELDRATQEVRQGFFELADSRKIAGHTLHKDTLIFAAVNGGEHVEHYQVGEMDPAELDRWVTFDLEPTVEDWLDWAKNNINSVIWNFINENHTHLEHKGNFEPNKVYPSRRSWHRFSTVMNDVGDLTDFSKNNTINFHNLAKAFIGLEGAIALQDYVKNYNKTVSAEDILDKGKINLTENWGVPEHVAYLEKLNCFFADDKTLTPKQVKNLAKYFMALPAEASAKLYVNLSRINSKIMVELHKQPGVSDKIVQTFIATASEDKKE